MTDLKQVLEFATQLSLNDRKTLLEKYVKAGEELGELAKVLLPYSNTDGTLHRFVGRKNITEEIADTMLTLYSIAASIGISDTDLLEMIYRKATKWKSIQIAERTLKNPGKIPFEIHISMIPNQSGFPSDIMQACKDVGVKYTSLLLIHPDRTTSHDWMTSSTYLGTNESAMREMERIVHELELVLLRMTETSFGQAPFKIVRKKIETVPWHPAAPNTNGPVTDMPKDCYFEKHWECLIHPELWDRFIDRVIASGCMVSRNLRKPLVDGQMLVSATYRSRNADRHQFDIQTKLLEAGLLRDFNIVDSIAEYSIYDTNIQHDAKWVATES